MTDGWQPPRRPVSDGCELRWTALDVHARGDSRAALFGLFHPLNDLLRPERRPMRRFRLVVYR